MQSLDVATQDRVRDVYGYVPESLAKGLSALLATAVDRDPASGNPALWDHRDVVLITYADQVRDDDTAPIEAQRRFLVDHGLNRLIRCVHFLPFCPSTSDDGFSVADYLQIDPDFGDWDDVARTGADFDLMFDLVLNHSSQEHEWFRKFLQGDPAYTDYYATADPADDLSMVVRPRALPLLTPFEAADGIRHVWTTFSADQVDLNYANPDVMLAMIETFVQYARHGARIIRLDAIAFLWKEIGTSCMHLPQTHAAVCLMRHILDLVVPGTLVLTETNVPHVENLSYFGQGDDEAHMVYQFSLPPLLLDAVHTGDTSILREWMMTLSTPSAETTFFNFTSSHDGIGMRPAEGLLPQDRLDQLVDRTRQHGGRVSMRSHADGRETPYELNITYLDAVADRHRVPPPDHSRRFLATQAIMLSMPGMPAIYFHSLVGSPNDEAAVVETGINRRINRHKYDRAELEATLSGPDSLQRRVFDGYKRLLEVRLNCPAFHPSARHDVLDLPTDGLLGFLRQMDGELPVTVVANLSDEIREIEQIDWPEPFRYDLLAEESVLSDAPLTMRPYQVRWLINRDERTG
ncbi:MAG: sugar phosphorylase [Planctomycetota bacterium]